MRFQGGGLAWILNQLTPLLKRYLTQKLPPLLCDGMHDLDDNLQQFLLKVSRKIAKYIPCAHGDAPPSALCTLSDEFPAAYTEVASAELALSRKFARAVDNSTSARLGQLYELRASGASFGIHSWHLSEP